MPRPPSGCAWRSLRGRAKAERHLARRRHIPSAVRVHQAGVDGDKVRPEQSEDEADEGEIRQRLPGFAALDEGVRRKHVASLQRSHAHAWHPVC